MTTLNQLPVLPSLNVPVRITPTLYRTNLLKAQAQLQTQQIDSAIQLLKAEYDAIIKSILSSDSRNKTMVPAAMDQTTFASQFELPAAAESVTDDIWSSLACGNKHVQKRSYPDDGNKLFCVDVNFRNEKSEYGHGAKRARRQ